jgi:hypothetical protein
MNNRNDENLLEGEDKTTERLIRNPFKMMGDENDAKKVRHEIDLEEAKKNIARAKSYWDAKHAFFQESLDFVYSDDIKDSWGKRTDPNRVQAHFKMIKRYVNKLMTAVRQNAPGIKLTSVNNSGDTPFAGIIRYIENKSQARIAYPKALEQALICGLGWLKISHMQEGNAPIKIKVIRDIQSAFFDPDSIEIDGSDGKFCFMTSKKRDSEGKEHEVIQYYEMHEERCWWAHIENNEIADQGQFILNGLPLIPVYGEFYLKQGEKIFNGLGKDLRSVNEFFDYSISTSVESVASQTKDPLIAYKGQVDLNQVADAATKPVPIIEIEKTDTAGEPFPSPPFRIPRQLNLDWLGASTSIFSKLFGDITGISDAAFGVDGSNIQSGYAIEMRQKAANNLLFSEYMDNLYASISYLGQMLADYASLVTNGQNEFLAMHPDGTITRQPIAFERNGKIYKTSFDMDDLEISGTVGKSYINKNQEFSDKFKDLLPMLPQDMMGLYMDLYWKSLDIPYSDILAKRAYAMVPTAARADGSVSMQEFQALQQQIQQMQEQNRALQQDNMMLLDKRRVDGQVELAKIDAKAAADTQAKLIDRDIAKEKDERDYEQEANLAILKGEFDAAKFGHEMEAEAVARVQDMQIEIAKDAQSNMIKREEISTKAAVDMSKIKKDFETSTAKITSDNAKATAKLAQELDFKKADLTMNGGTNGSN